MPTFRFSLKFLFWYFGIFCTSETIKYTDSV
ncbi:Protein CBG25968 [Caenorhabditis briggsae]|nr:Protein CBG25968 [Caenorhabditis briggsae]CAS00498.1 Protein CBG25968 [Caenorhabditis briggsae]